MCMLILASASPRRAELLRNAGISFIVDPAHVPEEPSPGESPIAYAQRLARDKTLAVLARHPAGTVLGADTVVVVDEQLLEKPIDADDAARMLRLLSGRNHEVITGVCVAELRIPADRSRGDAGYVRAALRRRDCGLRSHAASQWTRPARMPSKAWRRAGRSRSSAAISMWWDCRCRGFTSCYRRPKRSHRRQTALKQRLLLFLRRRSGRRGRVGGSRWSG